ncbi:zinc finger protein 302-like [Palaemon carinicauda]|uniref:zinc finger protein 302-like n=1 Tax=Palaemon carinicauda TaxID=392227 RepID=UPI0035B5C513
MMGTSEGSSLPIVHIRVVYEQGCKVYSCDFCFKTFPSEKALSCHICIEHNSVDIQDVFVCSVCNCCLLSQSDLLEHAAIRHQLQLPEELDTSYMLCEYCGAKVSNHESLWNHFEEDHAGYSFKKGYKSFNITELTLTEISNIGMGDKNCRTLFNVIELPLKDKKESKCEEREGLVKEMDNREEYCEVIRTSESEAVNLRKEKEHPKCSKDKVPLDKGFKAEVNMKDVLFEIDSKKQELLNKIYSCLESNEYENSDLDITVHCEPDELEFPSVKGELVLTVESEEKLIWSKDVVSKVLSSSGILGKSSTNDNICNLGPSHVNMIEAEVVTQPINGNKERSDYNHSFQVESNSSTETQVLVGCDDEVEKYIAEDKGQECRKGRKMRGCCVCGKKYTNMGELEIHENSVHGIRIKCDICSDTFAFSKSLRNHHLRKHNNSTSFSCEFCGKHFKSRGNLWTHRLSHMDSARKHECPHCSQRFISKTKLNNHLQTHSGKKKYQCGECSKGFVYPGTLVQHMSKHFSEEKWDMPENDTFYLVEVKTEDAGATDTSFDKQLL